MTNFLDSLSGKRPVRSPLPVQTRVLTCIVYRSAPSHREVLYLQSQNGNITSPHSDETEYACLRADIPSSFPFASDALGQEPDATNLWIGGSHSQTSLHKDPYENIYAVVRGSKTFTVLPPTEGVLLGSECRRRSPLKRLIHSIHE